LTIGVLALQGDVREHAAAFADLGEAVVEVRRPADLDGLAGLVVPGGESTTLSLLLGSAGLVDPLADALGAGLPVFGTCAGMILLATSVLDGRDDQLSFGVIDLTIRRNGYGRQVASFEGTVDVPVLGDEPLPAVFIRAPVVEASGPGVEVLATLPGVGEVPDRPVVCRQDQVLVASFHPELTADRRLQRLFVEMTKEERR
jgi:pyridoxal 5'-phosphate synthase pdxT subunit